MSFLNLNRTRLATLLLSLSLTAAPAFAQDAQRAVLSGRTGALAWTFYGPGTLGNLSADAKTTLRLSAPAGSTVIGSKYDNGSAVLAFRTAADTTLQDVYQFHDSQLTRQGFTRASQSINGTTANATYTRGNEQVKLMLDQNNPGSYRATLDLTAMQNMAMQNTTAASSPIAQAATNTTNTNTATPTVNLQNQTGNNPVITANDLAGVQYMLYGAGGNLGSLNSDPGTASFSVPQGATITNTSINGDGTLNAQVTSGLSLQQMMDFYDKQFKAQGFTLVNPTDTGAGGDNALTYIYERASSNSRVSFSVDKQDNYLLIWDFQDYAAFNRTGNATATAGLAPYGSPLYGYDYNNTRYDFYGATPTATSVNTLTPNAQRVIIAAPPAATNVQTPVQNGQQVQISFNSSMSLQDVFNFYDNQFTRQTFTQASGQLSQNATQIAARYDRGSASSVRLSVMQQGNNQYMVMMDFTPQQ